MNQLNSPTERKLSVVPPIVALPVIAPPVIGNETSTIVTYASGQLIDAPPGWTNVEIFRLRPDALAPFLLLVVLIQAAFGVLFYACFIGTVFWLAGRESAIGLLFTSGIWFVLAVCGAITYDILKYRRRWPLYRLILADQGLIEHSRKRTIRVERAQVAAIRATYDTYRVALADGSHFIQIPKRIEQIEQVRSRLAEWIPIQPGRGGLGLSFFIGVFWFSHVAGMVMFIAGLQTESILSLWGYTAVSFFCALIPAMRTWRNMSQGIPAKIIAGVQFLFPLILILRLTLWLIFDQAM